VAVIETLER